ncbi:MAG: NAAT family transporter [Streptosporangiales bacterium]|nr:NAAT family transporter [Streptosporangiales bacterium]
MSAIFDLRFFLEVFVTLIVIMDPPGTIPLFLALTGGYDAKHRARLAWQATAVSFAVIVAFALFGRSLLSYLHVEVPAMQAAGGLLLLLVALELLTGKQEEPTAQARAKTNVAMVPLGTPLLAGPGAIVATIVFVGRIEGTSRAVSLALAVVAVHAVLWLSMRFSVMIYRLIRENGVELVTRIAGLLLSAIAVQLVADAIRTFIREG